MAIIHAYLKFPRTAEEAIAFYQTVFSGEVLATLRYKDSPQALEVSKGDKEKIFFMALTIGHGTTLMATDVLELSEEKSVFGNNYAVYIGADSEEEASNIFAKLSAGGEVEVPLQKQAWGAYYGSLKDKFGIPWMVNFQEVLGPLKRRP